MSDKNTKLMIHLNEKAIKLGWNEKYPDKDFCQEVAIQADEVGNGNPSDEAILIALMIIGELRKHD